VLSQRESRVRSSPVVVLLPKVRRFLQPRSIVGQVSHVVPSFVWAHFLALTLVSVY
jgi:hypothetical protein